MDPDLGHWTPMDSLDDRHETTDQKGSAAAMRGSRRTPVYGSGRPAFSPLPSYADAAGSSLHQRGGTRTPGWRVRCDWAPGH